MINQFGTSNGEIIRIPASLCPLHLGHEDMIKKLENKVGNNIHIDIQGGSYTLKNMLKSNIDGRLDKKIEKVENREEFLGLEGREELIRKISLLYGGKITYGNTSMKDVNINDFEGNVIGTDLFNKIIKKLELGTKNTYKIFSFKKLYLIERIGYPTYLNYENILNNAGFNIEIIFLGKADFDISGTKIRAEYEKSGILGIKKFVSDDIFRVLHNIL